MKHLRLAAIAVLLGLVFIGGVAVRGQRQKQQTEQGVSPTEAMKEIDNFARRVFVNCGSESWYSIVRTATRDYRILEVKNLKTAISEEDDLSTADKANGIEWRGIGRLEAKISREYLPSRSELSEGRKGWQDWQDIENGTLAVFSIEKRNGKWLIENSDSSSYENKCAPTCELLTTPDRLHQVIEDRLYELVALQNKLNRRLTDFPFVLCASYHDYVKEISGLEKKANSGLSNEALPSEEEFQKAAEREAKKFMDAHYVKCGQYYYALLSRGPRGADVCLVRFSSVTWSLKKWGWQVEADYSESRSETGGKIIKRGVEIQINRTGASSERCVPGSLLLLGEGYYKDAWAFEGGRYHTRIPLLYSKDKSGERWSSIADDDLEPPACEKILFAWDNYKRYR